MISARIDDQISDRIDDQIDDRIDELMRALAHADRRLFVRACAGVPRAAGELAELSSLGLASVSEHLKVLRKCGLLVLDKQGRFRFYQTDRAVLRLASHAVVALGKGFGKE